MVGGSFVGDGGGPRVRGDSGGHVTAAVVITCIVAASGGLIFGYDIGISGGVTTMVPFLRKFFPSILEKSGDVKTNKYCMYDSQALTSFTSSLYIAGLAASLVASRITAKFGRKFTMVLGGCTFLFGAAVNGAAQNIAMLIFGRILLGFGVGFTNQATPLYLSEVAPPKWRGAFNTGFQFFIGIGVVTANCINYATAKKAWGWRLSLGFAVIPAAIMTLGVLIIPDTPNSLVERGKMEEAEKSLEKARGGNIDVTAEFAELIKATELAKAAKEEPFQTIFERHYRPHLVLAILIPFFQQITGINVIAFYAPVLFQSVGLGSDSALIAAIILGVVNLGSILVSTFLVDRFGRRFLFLEGGAQMFIFQIAVAGVLVATTGISGTEHISKGNTVLVLVFMCIYAAGFGWSWGPLSWLVPSEIFPLNIRPTGQSISAAVNFATTFVLSQTFLAMLCCFKFGAFFFYAGWIVIMTIFVALFLPETKGIPLDSMHIVWNQHWYWHKFVKQEP
ncbi:sugar transport protein 5 [Chenopodium quinoa]|uniref:Major facilitator superfamily (MFS) profile domain-containing protein n=1 Tax=Chenopodium quinoa TaxID=63459 RepID=A0A803ME56_CHEQI|nr:sugar transport protein 5 [Chenopodium quinoa]